MEKNFETYSKQRILMGSYSDVNLLHFASAELLMETFINFFTKETTIVRNKTISDSANITCNNDMNADIIFNRKLLEMFRPTSAKSC